MRATRHIHFEAPRTLTSWRRRGRPDAADRAGCVAGMIHLPASVRVYQCLTPCDMRKSFDSLQALVRGVKSASLNCASHPSQPEVPGSG